MLVDTAVGDGQGQAGEQQAQEAGGPQLHSRYSLVAVAWPQSPLALPAGATKTEASDVAVEAKAITETPHLD